MKMMLRNSSSSMVPYSRFPSEPRVGTGLSSSLTNCSKSMNKIYMRASSNKWLSIKCKEPVAVKQSAMLRRPLSKSNLITPLISNEETDQRIGKSPRYSRKNGLLSAANARFELNGMVLDEEGENSLDFESQVESPISIGQVRLERDSILRPEGSLSPSKGEDERRGIHKNLKRMSEKAVVECKPAHVCERAHMTEEGAGIGDGGGGFARTGSNGGEGGSFGADFNRIDVYYQKMLEANPANPLLLTNYAKFLHEVKHDMEKAEECYGRAILASPGDGEILSLYAKFIWESQRHAAQAEAYYHRAVEVASDDCYVVASYAHFLWNSEADEDENDLPADSNVASPTQFGPVAPVTA